MLPTHVHIGDRPDPSKLCKIVNYPCPDLDRDKPLGGLWASTLDVEYGTDWMRCCELDMGGVKRWHDNGTGHQAYQIHPAPDARILHIECEEDYEIVKELYPREARGMTGRLNADGTHTWTKTMIVDWEAVAEEYDIVYMQDYRSVRSWDCETVLYMRWSAVEFVEYHRWVSTKRERMCAA